MRIEELRLDAFGPFSARRLSLATGGDAGLCVVFGENEAGKSSALRAIRGLLYGIPKNSPDNFVHPHPELRIGARVRFRDGECFDVVRRKKQAQSLQAEGEGGARGIERLEALTQAIPESLFASFYGLDHPALVEGSRDLLADGGELGKALFGGGLGIPNLRKLLEALEREAADLFVARGSKQRIAIAAAEWKRLQTEIRGSALEPGRFAAQAERVADLERRLAVLAEALESTRAALFRARRRKELRLALAQAEEERVVATGRILREQAREAAILPAPEILALREPIERLHQHLEEYRKVSDQLPRREEEKAELADQIASLENALGPALASAGEVALRRILERAPNVRALVEEAARAGDRVAKAAERCLEMRAELARLQRGDSEAAERSGARSETAAGAVAAAANASLDPAALERVLVRVRRMAAIDGEIAGAEREQRALEGEQRRLRDRLALSDLDAARIEGLAIPAAEQIALHARRMAEHAERRLRRQAEREKLVAERAAVTEELARLHAAGSLPSEQDLLLERQRRDGLWGELRTRFVDPRDDGPGAGSASAASPGSAARVEIGERFEASLRAADVLADRLRGEAQRVAQVATCRARSARIEADLAAWESDDRRDEARQGELERAWRDAWPSPSIGPRLPEAGGAWRVDYERLLGLLRQGRELAEALASKQASRAAAIAQIDAALSIDERAGLAAGSDFEAWLEAAEAACAGRRGASQRAVEARQRREQAEQQVERAERDREQTLAQRTRWQADWDAELEVLGLPRETRPQDAGACLERIGQLLERRRELDKLLRRMDQMRLQAEGFVAESARLAGAGLSDMTGFGAVDGALRLKRELDSALERATLADAARAALAEAREQLAAAEERVAQRMAQWQALPDTDPEASGLDAFDADALEARIAALDDRQRAQQDERVELEKSLSVERAALAAMDGNARIAELAEQAEGKLAEIGVDARRFVDLTLARRILEAEIEAYRRQNQGPLLERAGELFDELTLGAYPRVLSDAGEDGRGRIVAVRRDGREIPVEGLSSGTRDQLFLALRLATLAASIEGREPMPLVADDILIEFDDVRTRATLEVLARFAEKTQILLFSHHRHVAEFAAALGARAHVVEL